MMGTELVHPGQQILGVPLYQTDTLQVFAQESLHVPVEAVHAGHPGPDARYQLLLGGQHRILYYYTGCSITWVVSTTSYSSLCLGVQAPSPGQVLAMYNIRSSILDILLLYLI